MPGLGHGRWQRKPSTSTWDCARALPAFTTHGVQGHWAWCQTLTFANDFGQISPALFCSSLR